MRYLLLFFCITLGFLSCRPDEDIIASEPINLRFEADTIAFDTIFTTELSITRRVKVYNPASRTVILDYIGLEKGNNSPFSLFVNGIRGKEFGEQQIFGGDSLLLLIEARLPATTDTLPYLADDKLFFSNRGLQQEVRIIGYGQNARFVSDSLIVCNEIWDSPIPYVFDKSVIVDSMCTLTITSGTRLFFKPGSTLYVKGSMVAKGDTAQTDRILFRSHRFGDGYNHQPGQWGGIHFMEGSKNNRLKFCTIRNATYGILLNTPDDDNEPDLIIENCRIENSLWGGIVCFDSDLDVSNTLVHSSARFTVAGLGGGNYRFDHCTFVNFFSQREQVPSLYLTDHREETESQPVKYETLNVRLRNSVVWGNLFSGLEIKLKAERPDNVQIEKSNNLLRTSDIFWEGNDNIISRDYSLPRFRLAFPFDYSPDSLSPLVDAALPLDYKFDVVGNQRDLAPDIGAFEFVPTPE